MTSPKPKKPGAKKKPDDERRSVRVTVLFSKREARAFPQVLARAKTSSMSEAIRKALRRWLEVSA